MVRLLGPIAEELVFVGGRVAELLVTEPGRTRVRPTDDSDAICEVATRTAYFELGERLRTAGFREDQSPGAPICRWRHGDEMLDVMPSDGSLLGFRNAWYEHALRGAIRVGISEDVTVRMAPPPVFIATKFAAFNDRGACDWYGSHDIEDIIAVVAARPELLEELHVSDEDVRRYVGGQVRALLESGLAEDVVAGALPDSRLVPTLVATTMRRLEMIAQLV
jgi:hypothetical protein